MLFRFCLYGFLKNQRYFEPFLVLLLLDKGLSFLSIGLLIACRDLTTNVLEIPSGAIADSTGRRASMMVSFVAYIISFVVFALADQTGLLFFAMICFGVGDTFRTGTHKAMIFEWLRLQGRSGEKTRIYGLTRSWSQIGSATSSIIAAAFVLVTGNYETIFWLATIPCLANLVNFAGYPAALDGDHAKSSSLRATWSRLRQSLKKSLAFPQLRNLMLETMGFEGYLDSVKDYLQPILQAAAILLLGGVALGVGASTGSSVDSVGWFNEPRQAAILIGPVYAVLFLLSAWASRQAHRWQHHAGSADLAARQLWLVSAGLFGMLLVGAWLHKSWLLVSLFVLLITLKNVWRPILISRFDELSEAHEGATILSIESQAKRGATLIFAPLMGWIIDQSGGEFWSIGAIGLLIGVAMLVSWKWRYPNWSPRDRRRDGLTVDSGHCPTDVP